MTSYCPQIRYRQEPDRWAGRYRYATRGAAEADLISIQSRRDDILAMRILESPFKPSGSKNKREFYQLRY